MTQNQNNRKDVVKSGSNRCIYGFNIIIICIILYYNDGNKHVLNDDNRTALWNALRWSATLIFSKYITKQKWFMETVDKFYFTYFGGISLPFNKSRENW
jgi:hypothetical protein